MFRYQWVIDDLRNDIASGVKLPEVESSADEYACVAHPDVAVVASGNGYYCWKCGCTPEQMTVQDAQEGR